MASPRGVLRVVWVLGTVAAVQRVLGCAGVLVGSVVGERGGKGRGEGEGRRVNQFGSNEKRKEK